eukprot:TRINITY_DN6634_c0_g1_i2.p1 TRINITY_DN6634_c0_g1~~TRINITY_DN6634_c0_g1_i2.p1  ORF type:complete len:368 (-),score=32.95 TRINITY_DN6634_c0_g1_i2:67-1110(-)
MSSQLIVRVKKGSSWSQAALLCAVSTLTCFLAVFGVLQPDRCSSVESCTRVYAETSVNMNRYFAAALSTALGLEVIALYLNHASARPILDIVHGIKESFLPQFLTCLTFTALLVEQLAFTASSEPWFVHTAAPGVFAQTNAPVYTIIYCEWLVNVPILLLLAGHFALETPMALTCRPIVVTNVYIVIAYAAHFVSEPQLRAGLIIIAFGMYAFASVDMMRWVSTYYRQTSPDTKGRTWRPYLTIGLILTFGVYGAVYLCSFLGIVSTTQAKDFFIIGDVITKLMFQIAFVGIRSSQYHELLIKSIVNANVQFKREMMKGDDIDAMRDSESEQSSSLTEPLMHSAPNI